MPNDKERKTNKAREQAKKVPYAGEPSKSDLQKVAGEIRLSNVGTLTDLRMADNADCVAVNIYWCDCSCTCESACSCSCFCHCDCICACSCDCSCICACSSGRLDGSNVPLEERRVDGLESAFQTRFGSIGTILNRISKKPECKVS